ncbi:hypothetical protein F5890DRAFT_1538073 [Lentinula detonsa]|uniref:Uncharacterized protein n=1 Tax=Lentinula detonsa TaxID=2804962 RepID=A0AA38PTM2_9AGAR|nr:hypothetical protein F5890DRAFT_1538073 [Lentinula detonsa]
MRQVLACACPSVSVFLKTFFSSPTVLLTFSLAFFCPFGGLRALFGGWLGISTPISYFSFFPARVWLERRVQGSTKISPNSRIFVIIPLFFL